MSDRTVTITFTEAEAVEMADGWRYPTPIRVKFIDALDSLANEDYDPTDADMGGLALSWHVSRDAVEANPNLTDGLD